jgi:hypothetical protein
MEENVVNNVEHRTNEQNLDVNNQTLENSIQNQSNLEQTGRVIVRRKPKPMQPTRLYTFFFCFIYLIMNNIFIREYAWWSTYPNATRAGVFGLFVMTTIFIGVLIVSLTTKNTSMSFL